MRVGVKTSAELDGDILRLNGGFYLSSDRVLSEALRDWSGEHVSVADVARCYKGNIFKRIYVDDVEHSRPYISASDLDRTDYWGCRRISTVHGALLNELELRSGTTVITRSGVNLGWGALVRPDLDRVVGSDDLIRVVPNSEDDVGFIGAFLCSPVGRVAIRKYTYATSIKHIEPEHVALVKIPWFTGAERERIGANFWQAAQNRSESYGLIQEATRLVFDSVGLSDLDEGEWHGLGREVGFVAQPNVHSLRGWNYSVRATALGDSIRGVAHSALEDLVVPGTLKKGPSFTRIDAVPPHSVQLIGQRQLFRYLPEGRQVSRTYLPARAFCKPGTVAIASVGRFGESEVFCRAQLVTERTAKWAYSNHVLRVVGKKGLSGWLYAFLRSRTAFRLLRSIATGSIQQDLHSEMLAKLPVPVADAKTTQAVQGLVDKASRLRDEASQLEADAFREVRALLTGGA